MNLRGALGYFFKLLFFFISFIFFRQLLLVENLVDVPCPHSQDYFFAF